MITLNTLTYWEEREKDRLTTEMMSDKEVNERIKVIINGHMERIINDIESFYHKYADEAGISNATAKKMIDNLDMEHYEKLAQYYVKNRHDKELAFSDEANRQMKIYNVTMKINREKLILAEMFEHLKNMGVEIEAEMKDYLEDSTVREFERQAGILGSINLSRTQFEAIINSTHLDDNKIWSERLWKNVAEVRKEVDKTIKDSLLRGRHPKESVSRLRELTGRSDFEARRLLLTETTRVQSEAQLLSMKEKNTKKFIFLAQIDDRTTVKCRHNHKEVFELKKAKIGLNVPPLHQFCRSSIAPHITPEDVKEEGGGIFNIFEDDERDEEFEEISGSDDGALDELERLLDKIEGKTGIEIKTPDEPDKKQRQKTEAKKEKVKKQVEKVHEELEDEVDKLYPKGHPFYDKQDIIRQIKNDHPEISYQQLEVELADHKIHFEHLMNQRDLNYGKNLFNYKMVDKELIHDNIKQYINLIDEFPAVKDMMNDTNHIFQVYNRKAGWLGRVRRRSFGQEITGIELELAKHVFRTKDENIRVSKGQSDSGFNMKADEGNYHLYTMTHEFGHLYHFGLAHKMAKVTGAQFDNSLVSKVGKMIIDNYRKALEQYGIDEIAQVSEYGRSSINETIAELFVHFILHSNPVTASQILFSVMQGIDEMLDEKLKEE